jgi:hypothetical protein
MTAMTGMTDAQYNVQCYWHLPILWPTGQVTDLTAWTSEEEGALQMVCLEQPAPVADALLD